MRPCAYRAECAQSLAAYLPARSAADRFIELRVIMIKPNQSDIGRTVIWRVHGSAKEGVITRFNEKYVFVRFGKEEKSTVATRDELEWKDARSRS
jgi:hypothetical protein